MRLSHARRDTTTKTTRHTALVRAATTVAVAAVALTTAGAAQAAPTEQQLPRFLEAADLPPHPSSDWQAGDVTTGLPEVVPFCVDALELPAEQASHRVFTTELDTGASQVSFVGDSAESAAELATRLEDSVANCAADWLRDHPGGTASWRDLGTQDVGDGARSYGVQIETDHGSQDVHLFGVGRDGDTVTLVSWGQMGTFEGAPVAAYEETVRTAVAKLAG